MTDTFIYNNNYEGLWKKSLETKNGNFLILSAPLGESAWKYSSGQLWYMRIDSPKGLGWFWVYIGEILDFWDNFHFPKEIL